jgi:hypothetical protein
LASQRHFPIGTILGIQASGVGDGRTRTKGFAIALVAFRVAKFGGGANVFAVVSLEIFGVIVRDIIGK